MISTDWVAAAMEVWATSSRARRREIAHRLEKEYFQGGPHESEHVVRPLLSALAQDADDLVRKHVANVLHLVPQHDYDRLQPLLAGDCYGFVRAAAERAAVRRTKLQQERRRVDRTVSELRKIAPRLLSDEPDASAPARAGEAPHREPAATPAARIPLSEVLTLDQFMQRYCQPLSKPLRRSRRQALLAAARRGKLSLPPQAARRSSGQSARYHARDLVACWRQWIDQGHDLPPLRP
jgi:hypothetical protein